MSDSGLITIAGGKWTTFRLMALQTIDKAIEVGRLRCVSVGGCCETAGHLHALTVPAAVRSTHRKQRRSRCWAQQASLRRCSLRWHSRTTCLRTLPNTWQITTAIKVFPQLFQQMHWSQLGCGGLTSTVSFAAHKIGAAAKAAAEGSASQHAGGAGTRLHPSFPFTEEEVRFAVKEYTCTVADMLFRRLRLAFLDLNVARSVAPRVRTAQHSTAQHTRRRVGC